MDPDLVHPCRDGRLIDVDPRQRLCNRCGEIFDGRTTRPRSDVSVEQSAGSRPTDSSSTAAPPAASTCRECNTNLEPGRRQCPNCLHINEVSGPPTSPGVILRFPDGSFRVHPGPPTRLGRGQPAAEQMPSLGADNISRLHATVWVDKHGAWIQDEDSTNGTFLNDRALTPGQPTAIAPSDLLRFAADVKVVVLPIASESP